MVQCKKSLLLILPIACIISPLKAMLKLDTSFGTRGVVTTPFVVNGREVPARALAGILGVGGINAGKILAAGFATNNRSSGFALARYNPNGALDTQTFGNFGGARAGMVFTPASAFSIGTGTAKRLATNAQAHGIIQLPNGTIVTAGFAVINGRSNFALAFYQSSNGKLINTVVTPSSKFFINVAGRKISASTAQANALIRLNNGNLAVAGFAVINNDRHFALAVYSSNGKILHNTAVVQISPLGDQANALMQLANKSIVAAGSATVGTGINHFALAFFDGAGNFSRGSARVATGAFGGVNSQANALIQLPNSSTIAPTLRNALVLGGFAASSSSTNAFALLPFNPTSSIFGHPATAKPGSKNRITVNAQANALVFSRFANNARGGLVAGGLNSSAAGIKSGFALAEFNGSLTPTSTISTPMAGAAPAVTALIPSATSSTVIAVGFSANKFALARYIDPALPKPSACKNKHFMKVLFDRCCRNN